VALPMLLIASIPRRTEWAWFWVFPAPSDSTDPRSGITRRHHMHVSGLQKNFKVAVLRAGLQKSASVTPCATVSRLISCNPATTSVLCRSSWPHQAPDHHALHPRHPPSPPRHPFPLDEGKP